jgi:hypothetical protein
MTSTFHNDGKTRLCYRFEDNFDFRMTQMQEGADDEDMPFIDTNTSS